jgi:hypothetical protein
VAANLPRPAAQFGLPPDADGLTTLSGRAALAEFCGAPVVPAPAASDVDALLVLHPPRPSASSDFQPHRTLPALLSVMLGDELQQVPASSSMAERMVTVLVRIAAESNAAVKAKKPGFRP